MLYPIWCKVTSGDLCSLLNGAWLEMVCLQWCSIIMYVNGTGMHSLCDILITNKKCERDMLKSEKVTLFIMCKEK